MLLVSPVDRFRKITLTVGPSLVGEAMSVWRSRGTVLRRRYPKQNQSVVLFRILRARILAAPAPVAALTLGMTVPAEASPSL